MTLISCLLTLEKPLHEIAGQVLDVCLVVNLPYGLESDIGVGGKTQNVAKV